MGLSADGRSCKGKIGSLRSCAPARARVRGFALAGSLCLPFAAIAQPAPGSPAHDVSSLPAEDDHRLLTNTDLPVYLITATRLVVAPEDLPYAFHRVEREALDEAPGRTLTDRIQYAPGVVIQHTAPNQASPILRGLTGEQTLLLLDGVRYNHAAMRPGPNQYAALIAEESVSSVDIILGSVSAMTGSDGLTGALDFRLAPAGRGVDEPLSLWTRSRVSSSEGLESAAGADGRSGAWAYSLEGSVARYHDLVGGRDFASRVFGPGRDHYDEIPNTAYRQHTLGARVSFAEGDRQRLELMAGETTQEDSPRPDGFFENSGDPSRVRRFLDPQRFRYVHLRHSVSSTARPVARTRTTVWYHQHHEEEYRDDLRNVGEPEESFRRREYSNTVDVGGGDLQVVSLPTDDHVLTWGGTVTVERTSDAYRELRTAAGVADAAAAVPYDPDGWTSLATIPDGSEYSSLGLFVQDQWRVFPGCRVLAGLRYSRNDWSADLTGRGYVVDHAEGDADDVTSNMRVSFDVAVDQMVFTGWSQGFRAPNLTNLTGRVDRGSSGDFHAGNPDLAPEQSWSLEAGWRYAGSRGRLSLAAFRTVVDDLIQNVFLDVDGDGRTEPVVRNAESALLSGFEWESDWSVPGIELPRSRRLSIVSSLGFVRATIDVPQPDGTVQEENLSRANRFVGKAGLRLDLRGGWWALSEVRFSDRYDRTSPRDAEDARLTVAGAADGSMPGFAVVDLRGGWRRGDGRRFVMLAAENLLDETYRDPGSGVDGPGIGLAISGGARF